MRRGSRDRVAMTRDVPIYLDLLLGSAVMFCGGSGVGFCEFDEGLVLGVECVWIRPRRHGDWEEGSRSPQQLRADLRRRRCLCASF